MGLRCNRREREASIAFTSSNRLSPRTLCDRSSEKAEEITQKSAANASATLRACRRAIVGAPFPMLLSGVNKKSESIFFSFRLHCYERKRGKKVSPSVSLSLAPRLVFH